jgi:hypothetical protein
MGPLQKLLFLMAAASGIFFQSCAHYQSGDGTAVPFNSIQISPVVNKSQAPQINQVLNHDLRETFIQSGKVMVESSGANAQLDVTVTGFQRETIATNSQDTGLARKYAITLTSNCSLINLLDETPYFSDRRIEVTLDIFLDSGQTQAETIAMPELSKKLAQTIANEVLHVW